GLFAVRIGEHHAFLSDAVDVGRVIAHEAVRVAAEVQDADVVAPNHEDVRLVGLSHAMPPLVDVLREDRRDQGFAPWVDAIANTASRLNDAGFWRGGNLMKLSICAATTACIRYICGM